MVEGQLSFPFWISVDLKDAPNSELLSALTGKPAAEALIQRYGNLTNLAQASFGELQNVNGVGESKAAAIRAAFLLAQRLARESYPDAPLLDSPDRVADLLREEFRSEPVEHMRVILVNVRRRLIAVHSIAQGTLDTLLVHPREIFRDAITSRASAVILAHNHPSGDPNPSEADIRITRDLIQAGRLLKIEVLDHIILGQRTPERPKDFASLKELGYFY